ncbi:DoxX family protein [Hymenobacter persicinus]|uniref:DoxX family protein n=1 Tax=Hymenobacter persicinus TaxID=2025506 RepID=A0A4Q5LEH9_9BACT|nr:DoxX family protein [Hymenobacter persicinus]RYU82458.1 DoxX family protein [Hymenobacter persicinus]
MPAKTFLRALLIAPSAAFSSRWADTALLLFRLHLGLSIAIGAGWAKLVGLYTATEAAKLAGAVPAPPDWFVQQVAGLGFTQPSPYLWAWLACWGEFAGGLLLALGLLTRWSALQLAFQFFVVAFLWYEAPEPLLGMYYQQLLFWSFGLVAVLGSGRYSLDHWLSQKRLPRVPRVALAGALLLALLTAPVAAQAPATVAMRELAGLARPWQGSLTYLDYQTKRPVTLPTVLNGMQSAPRELVLDFIYQEPEGGQVKGYDKLQLSADGRRIIWDGTPMQVISRQREADRTLVLVLEGPGQDDNRACLIRRTLRLGTRQLSVVKEVKYADSAAFLTRNTYRFTQGAPSAATGADIKSAK